MASGERFYAVDPSTLRPFAELPGTSAVQVAEMVADGHRALAVEQEWRAARVRARALSALAAAIEGGAGALADLECRDTGAPLSRARADVAAVVACLESGAGEEGRVLAGGPGVLDYTLREPWGVCAQVLGSARPLRAAARCVLPALAAGNAVIVKPSEQASIALLALAELAEAAGVPRGMLQVATGDGAVGAALAADVGVDHVTFCGGASATGAAVAGACAPRGVPVVLAPAGKCAHLVFAGADLSRAVAGVVAAVRAGESTGVWLLAERALLGDLVARVAAALAAVSVGPGVEDPDLGPVTSESRLERAQALLASARADGATVAGGEPAGGLLMRPALVSGVGAEAEIVRADVRGPVVCALAFDTEWEAVALAGAAVSACVWTRDISRGHAVAAGLAASRVGVNGAACDARLDVYSRVKRVSVTL